MQKNELPDYDRAPIDPLKALCGADGLLRPLMCLNGRPEENGRKTPLDVHFRRDEIHVYCGHPRVFRVRLLQQTREVEIEMGHAGGQSPTRRRWRTDEDAADVETALNEHLRSVNEDAIVKGEGILQARWAGLGYGEEAGPPWTMVDREVQLSFENIDARKKAEEKIEMVVGPARRTIEVAIRDNYVNDRRASTYVGFTQ